MPFDAPSPADSARARDRRHVALWLFAMCGMILVMVAIGGATRLTGSGLSIMEWAPLRGTLPPLSEAEWNRLYALYRQIPQYELVNKGFGLAGFKEIFWLEWLHRLWGRLIGLAFIVPLGWLWWRRAVPRALVPRLLGLFVLGGLQGVVGWFMVASGFFADATAVSPYRLVVHLGLALVLYAAILWTALDVLSTRPVEASRGLRRLVGATAACVALTILAGGFVAGLKAGLDYNTFPLMGGRVVPAGYAALDPFLLNFVENIAAVQFNHRLLATLSLLLAGACLVAGWRSAARPALLALAGAVGVQYGLGIATLIYVVPAGLGTAHQAMAVLVLTAALVALDQLRTRRPPL
ncbi:MAG: COX15/CtaA family protein [Acetobacteraceae bacterium]|nr:COX15/CtaA family protein [Acetobacteraceae bacterium]